MFIIPVCDALRPDSLSRGYVIMAEHAETLPVILSINIVYLGGKPIRIRLF